METFKLKGVPTPPKSATVLAFVTAPGMRGEGDKSYRCGWCETVLLENITGPEQVQGVFFQCPGCGKHSTFWTLATS